MDEAFDVDCSSIIASCEAPEMLEVSKASFDLIALFVSRFIVGDEDLAVSLRRDHRFGLHVGNHVAQVIAVICFIGEYCAALLSFQEAGGFGDVVRLASRYPKAQRPSERGGQHMDLGRQSTSGRPKA